jgi:hypothetical protein
MRYLKLFEAYTNAVGGIIRFLDVLNDDDAAKFFRKLEKISREYDIPISKIKGDYVKSNFAKKGIDTSDNLITFWFSLKNGLTIITTNKPIRRGTENWNKSVEVTNFTDNNSPFNIYFNTKDIWYEEDYNLVKDADFALIINITQCEKGLKNLLNKRASNEPLPRINNDYYRRQNIKRWRDKLGGVSKDDREFLHYMLDKIYDEGDASELRMIDRMTDLYYRREITEKQFLTFVKDFYMDDFMVNKFNSNRYKYKYDYY